MAAQNPAASWIDVNKPVDLPVFTAAQLVRDVYKKQHDHLEALKRRLSTRMVESPQGAVWEEDLLQAEYELNPAYKQMVDRLAKMDEGVRDLEDQKAKADTKLQRVRLEGKLRTLLSQRLTVSQACRTMHDIAASAKADDEDRAKRIDDQQKLADTLEVKIENSTSVFATLRMKFQHASALRAKAALEKERDWLHKKDQQMGIDNLYNKILRRAMEIQRTRRFDKLERANLTDEIADAETELLATQKVLSAAWRLERAGVRKLSVPLMKKRDKDTVMATVMDALGRIDTLDKDMDDDELSAIAMRQLEDAANMGADPLIGEIHADMEGRLRRRIMHKKPGMQP